MIFVAGKPGVDDFRKSIMGYTDANTADAYVQYAREMAQKAVQISGTEDDGALERYTLQSLKAVNDVLYSAHQYRSAEIQDLFTSEDYDEFPCFQWSSAKSVEKQLGLISPSRTDVQQMRSVMRSIAEFMGVDLARPYLFLEETDRVKEALTELYRDADTLKSNITYFRKALEVIGHPLQAEYQRWYFEDVKPEATLKESKPTLNAQDVHYVRKATGKLYDLAMETIAHPKVHEYDFRRGQIIQDCLVALLTYGLTENWCPQRCDLTSLRFFAMNTTDRKNANYCEVKADGKVIIVYNWLNKVSPKTKMVEQERLKDPLEIPVHEICPKTAEFLAALKTMQEEIQGPDSYLFTGYAKKKDWGKSMGRNVLSLRCGRKNRNGERTGIFQRMADRGFLPKDLVELADGIDKVRHGNIAEERQMVADGQLTDEEVKGRHEMRGQKPPRHAASEHYANDQASPVETNPDRASPTGDNPGEPSGEKE